MSSPPAALLFLVTTGDGHLVDLTTDRDRAWQAGACAGGLVAVLSVAADFRGREGNPLPAGAPGGRGSGPRQGGPPAGGGQPDSTIPTAEGG